jgi:hypothetical protein
MPSARTASLEGLLAGMRSVEQGFATPAADGWRFTTEPPADAAGLALVVAEKD